MLQGENNRRKRTSQTKVTVVPREKHLEESGGREEALRFHIRKRERNSDIHKTPF